MSNYLGHPAFGLGRNQRHVLITMSDGKAYSSRWSYWYPLTPEQAMGAIRGLGKRGLVDVSGWDGPRREYTITAKGLEVCADLGLTENDMDDDE